VIVLLHPSGVIYNLCVRRIFIGKSVINMALLALKDRFWEPSVFLSR